MLLSSLTVFEEITAFIFVILFLFIFVLFIMRQNMNRKLIASDEINTQLTHELRQNGKQIQEMRSIVLGFSQQLTNYKEQIKCLNERLVEIEQMDGDSSLYSRANKMLQLGADIEELIIECELPKAEAELMMSLQNKITGKEKIPPLAITQ